MLKSCAQPVPGSGAWCRHGGQVLTAIKFQKGMPRCGAWVLASAACAALVAGLRAAPARYRRLLDAVRSPCSRSAFVGVRVTVQSAQAL